MNLEQFNDYSVKMNKTSDFIMLNELPFNDLIRLEAELLVLRYKALENIHKEVLSESFNPYMNSEIRINRGGNDIGLYIVELFTDEADEMLIVISRLKESCENR